MRRVKLTGRVHLNDGPTGKKVYENFGGDQPISELDACRRVQTNKNPTTFTPTKRAAILAVRSRSDITSRGGNLTGTAPQISSSHDPSLPQFKIFEPSAITPLLPH